MRAQKLNLKISEAELGCKSFLVFQFPFFQDDKKDYNCCTRWKANAGVAQVGCNTYGFYFLEKSTVAYEFPQVTLHSS